MKEQIAEIVAAYLKHNTISPDQVPGLIEQVHASLSRLGQPAAKPASALSPAVPIRRSVGADEIICIECGFKSKMLKRHLSTAHGLSPDEYRSRWKLASDYPMTSKNYSTRRSELAKSAGLGTRARRAHK